MLKSVLLFVVFLIPAITFSQTRLTTEYSNFGVGGALGPDALRCIGTSVSNPCQGSIQTLSYDVNGSVSTSQDSHGITNYSYNHDNKLLRSSGSNHTTENIYGPHGERVATIEDGNTTFFFDNGLEVGTQGKTQSYFFGGERVAMKDQGRDTRFFLSDHLNSVRAVTDSHGTVLTRSDYYPFGETRSQSGISSFNSSYKFNGNRSDPDGVYDYNARSMNPVVARFLQPDSIIPDEKDPQSLNRYAYVQNNPLRNGDPSGHSILDVVASSLLTSAPSDATHVHQPPPEGKVEIGPIHVLNKEEFKDFQYREFNKEMNAAISVIENGTLFVVGGGLADIEAGVELGIGGAAKFSARSGADAFNPTEAIRFSQSTVTKSKVLEFASEMSKSGTSDWKPLEMVHMRDGTITTLDHHRLMAARLSGNQLTRTVHAFDEAVSPGLARSYGVPNAKNWGEIVRGRTAMQRDVYWSMRNPIGSFHEPKMIGE